MVKRRAGVQVFVEGGGDSESLRSECRRAFSKLSERAGFKGKMPTFVACGTRRNAFERFVTACASAAEKDSLLLVDSEEAVKPSTSPWEHVRQRAGDGGGRPPGAADENLHFMTECLEAWLLTDPQALAKHYGQDWNKSAFPARSDIEKISKNELYQILKRVAGPRGYSKGEDSFKILALVDTKKLRSGDCPWAKRFFDELERRS